MTELCRLSLTAQMDGLRQRRFSSEELVTAHLEAIKTHNPRLNAFITLAEETALGAAREADAKPDGQKPLQGLPFACKDIFCTEGLRTSCGSRMLHDFIAPYESTVTGRLASAGGILLGKTNMDEFAMGSSNETSFYGPVRNPWDLQRVPGGSSGGSAAAVAAGLVPGAAGTDTGGSIRQPASLCGITGMKPTYGRVSRWGMIAFASSLDQAGPLTRSAEDAAWLLQYMSGHDPKDSTSIDAPVPDYRAGLSASVAGMRLGICEEHFDGLDDRVAQLVMDAIHCLEAEGAKTKRISLPNTRLSVPAYYVIAPAECSANLSRFDGVRYGHRCDDPADIQDLFCRSRTEGFGLEVQRRIMLGAFVLSAGYYDAYYRKAQQIRRLILNDFLAAFQEVDLIVGPTAPAPAFKLGDKRDDQIGMYLQDIFTIAANLSGVPAISVPAGLLDGLPVGLQITGNHLDEARILQTAHRYQLVTDWHRQTPVIQGAAV